MDKTKKIVKLGNLSSKGSESGEVFYRGGCSRTLCASDYKHVALVVRKWQRKKIIILGGIGKTERENRDDMRVVFRGGCSPTITTICGGGQEPKTIKKFKHEDRS